MKLLKRDYHRNGISGVPFSVFIFKDDDNTTKLGIQFISNDIHTAIFDLDLLSKKNITFGENSFRGDHYHEILKKFGKGL